MCFLPLALICATDRWTDSFTHTHTQKWTYYDPSAPLWFPFKKQSCLSKFPMTSWHSHGHVNTHKYTTPTPPSSFFTLTHTMLYLAKLMTGRTFSPAAEQLRLWEHIFFQDEVLTTEMLLRKDRTFDGKLLPFPWAKKYVMHFSTFFFFLQQQIQTVFSSNLICV